MDQWLETRQLPVHFVSAAGFVYKDDKVLLIKTQKRGWELPGGVVEPGESILDGLKREISEESGVIAEAEKVVGIYQRLSSQPGYGPLEGMVLPTTVNLTFICKYVGGKATVSEESIDVDWFAPNEIKEKITDPYIKKAVQDLLEFDGKQHFCTFEKIADGKLRFVSDILV